MSSNVGNLTSLLGQREQSTSFNHTKEIPRFLEQSFLKRHTHFDLPLEPGVLSTIAIALSPDGGTISSTHGDHTVKVFKYPSGAIYRVFYGHPRTPWTVKYHPVHSQIVASGCLGCEVRVWDIKLNQCINLIRLEFSIISLAFQPNSHHIGIASGPNLHLWEWGKKSSRGNMGISRKIVQHSRNIRALMFHPDGDIVFAAAPDPPRMAQAAFTPCRLYAIRCSEMLQMDPNEEPPQLVNLHAVIPQVHLYSDGGIDISADGKYLLTCAMLHVPPSLPTMPPLTYVSADEMDLNSMQTVFSMPPSHSLALPPMGLPANFMSLYNIPNAYMNHQHQQEQQHYQQQQQAARQLSRPMTSAPVPANPSPGRTREQNTLRNSQQMDQIFAPSVTVANKRSACSWNNNINNNINNNANDQPPISRGRGDSDRMSVDESTSGTPPPPPPPPRMSTELSNRTSHSDCQPNGGPWYQRKQFVNTVISHMPITSNHTSNTGNGDVGSGNSYTATTISTTTSNSCTTSTSTTQSGNQSTFSPTVSTSNRSSLQSMMDGSSSIPTACTLPGQIIDPTACITPQASIHSSLDVPSHVRVRRREEVRGSGLDSQSLHASHRQKFGFADSFSRSGNGGAGEVTPGDRASIRDENQSFEAGSSSPIDSDLLLQQFPVPLFLDPKTENDPPPGWMPAEHLCVFRVHIGDMSHTDVNMQSTHMTLRRAKQLSAALMKAVTSAKLSPTGQFGLIGFGVRSNGVVEDHPFRYVASEVLDLEDVAMTTVTVMPDQVDEVNIAQFHPLPGCGVLYGTKRGKVRMFLRSSMVDEPTPESYTPSFASHSL